MWVTYDVDSGGFHNTLMEFLLEVYIDLLTAEFSWKSIQADKPAKPTTSP